MCPLLTIVSPHVWLLLRFWELGLRFLYYCLLYMPNPDCATCELGKYLLKLFPPKNISECLKSTKSKLLSNAHKAVFPPSFCHNTCFPIPPLPWLWEHLEATQWATHWHHNTSGHIVFSLPRMGFPTSHPHILSFVQIRPWVYLGLLLTWTVEGSALNVYKCRKNNRVYMMAHVCNPRTGGSEAGRRWVWGQTGLHNRTVLKNKTKNKKVLASVGEEVFSPAATWCKRVGWYPWWGGPPLLWGEVGKMGGGGVRVGMGEKEGMACK